jgi:DDE superfamily endonuclease
MPMCFREFNDKVVVIVDCFEVVAEKPSGAANQIHIYSQYKHNQTVKFLIGITPQGTVSFISEAWGGRSSDKHIIEESGLLNNLLPNDILMADRGFKINDSVQFYRAKLAIPDFTRGKKQLHPLEVENTRKIASVRIHVERIIGLVKRKFGILQTTIPLEFLKKKKTDQEPTIDKIVKVCCCLVNLHPSIIPFD